MALCSKIWLFGSWKRFKYQRWATLAVVKYLISEQTKCIIGFRMGLLSLLWNSHKVELVLLRSDIWYIILYRREHSMDFELLSRISTQRCTVFCWRRISRIIKRSIGFSMRLKPFPALPGKQIGLWNGLTGTFLNCMRYVPYFPGQVVPCYSHAF